jgi:hypothetical protein
MHEKTFAPEIPSTPTSLSRASGCDGATASVMYIDRKNRHLPGEEQPSFPAFCNLLDSLSREAIGTERFLSGPQLPPGVKIRFCTSVQDRHHNQRAAPRCQLLTSHLASKNTGALLIQDFKGDPQGDPRSGKTGLIQTNAVQVAFVPNNAESNKTPRNSSVNGQFRHPEPFWLKWPASPGLY